MRQLTNVIISSVYLSAVFLCSCHNLNLKIVQNCLVIENATIFYSESIMIKSDVISLTVDRANT